MDHAFDFISIPSHGWEVRSRLTRLSFEGTVAAGATLYFEEACKCHLMSSRQFTQGDDAIRAIEIKATHWIAQRAASEEAVHDEPTLLS